MIKKISASEKDKAALAEANYDPMKDLADEPDYAAVLIKKPWGYEYLLFKDKEVAVWVLHIESDFQTSLHCHPNKKTSLTVLAGEVAFSTLHETINVRPGEGLLIDKGVFHTTRAVSPGGAVVMETETPNYKHDLVRLNDKYGRERQGYEGKTYHVALNDREYPKSQMFHKPNERYDTVKKIGACDLMIVRYAGNDELKKFLATSDANLAGILKGELREDQAPFLGHGDIVDVADLRAPKNICLTDAVELLLIKFNPKQA